MQVTGRPKPQFRERHWDYAVRHDEWPQLKAITPGQKVTIPFTFDLDAPFVLRSRALRVPYSVACGGLNPASTNLNYLRMRFSDSTAQFRSQSQIRQLTQMAYYGQWGLPLPVYPEIFYPAGSTMLIDLYNDGPAEIDNLTLYFRGVKLFPWGQRRDDTYPAKFSQLPYTYTFVPPTDQNPIGQVLNLGVKETRLNQVFKLQDDADFVIRSGQAGLPGSAQLVFEIFFKLYDSDNYPYSNVPVHFDVVFGNFTTEAIFQYGASGTTPPYGAGPYAPGLFYPEIYLPKTRIMYYDIYRDDSAISCAAAASYPVLLNGAKVFPL